MFWRRSDWEKIIERSCLFKTCRSLVIRLMQFRSMSVRSCIHERYTDWLFLSHQQEWCWEWLMHHFRLMIYSIHNACWFTSFSSWSFDSNSISLSETSFLLMIDSSNAGMSPSWNVIITHQMKFQMSFVAEIWFSDTCRALYVMVRAPARTIMFS